MSVVSKTVRTRLVRPSLVAWYSSGSKRWIRLNRSSLSYSVIKLSAQD